LGGADLDATAHGADRQALAVALGQNEVTAVAAMSTLPERHTCRTRTPLEDTAEPANSLLRGTDKPNSRFKMQ